VVYNDLNRDGKRQVVAGSKASTEGAIPNVKISMLVQHWHWQSNLKGYLFALGV
jgi:hypothetical protein